MKIIMKNVMPEAQHLAYNVPLRPRRLPLHRDAGRAGHWPVAARVTAVGVVVGALPGAWPLAGASGRRTGPLSRAEPPPGLPPSQ